LIRIKGHLGWMRYLKQTMTE
jgi:hypothetical protein